MGIDVEIERLAMHVRRGAGYGDDEALDVEAAVLHWLGLPIATSPRMTVPGALAMVDGRWQVQIQQRARDPLFVAAHELGHWSFRHVAMPFQSLAAEERAANLFAAILLAPRALVVRAFDHYGEAIGPIAEGIGISQTATVLRLGEVRGEDRAVVTRTEYAHVRGPRMTRERALDAARGNAPGLVTARLRGGIDEGRVAIRSVG